MNNTDLYHSSTSAKALGSGVGEGGEAYKNIKETTGSSNNRMGRIVSNVLLPNQDSQHTNAAAAMAPPTSGPRIAPLFHENDAPPSCSAKTRGMAQEIERRQPIGSMRRKRAMFIFGMSNFGIDSPRITVAVAQIGALTKYEVSIRTGEREANKYYFM